MSKSAARRLDSDKYFWTSIARPAKDQHSKTTAMMGTALAAAGAPIPLELRLRLSRLHVRLKIRGGDEIISIQADSVYHREELTTFVDELLQRRRAVHGNKFPAPGAWELRSDGALLDLADWTSDMMTCALVEISACTTRGETPLVTIHRTTLPPVYVDVPQRATIEFPERPFAFVIFRLSQRSAGGRKIKVQLLKKIELVADKSITLEELLPYVNTTPSQIYSASIRDRTDGLAGVAIASGQYGVAISSILEGHDLDVDVILK